jgi:hypothetical protein
MEEISDRAMLEGLEEVIEDERYLHAAVAAHARVLGRSPRLRPLNNNQSLAVAPSHRHLAALDRRKTTRKSFRAKYFRGSTISGVQQF